MMSVAWRIRFVASHAWWAGLLGGLLGVLFGGVTGFIIGFGIGASIAAIVSLIGCWLTVRKTKKTETTAPWGGVPGEVLTKTRRPLTQDETEEIPGLEVEGLEWVEPQKKEETNE